MTIVLPPEKILDGKITGQSVRNRLHLDELDYNTEPEICVLLSVKTCTMNTSFFIGCFLESMYHLGSKIRFEEKYKFFPEYRYLINTIVADIESCEKILQMDRRNKNVTIH